MINANFCAAGLINPVCFDFNGNCGKILNLCQKAKKKAVSLVAFPELCLTGYGCGDFFNHQGFCAEAKKALLSLKDSLPEGLTAGIGLPRAGSDGRVYDCYVLLNKKEILGVAAVRAFDGSRDSRLRFFTPCVFSVYFELGGKCFAPASVFELGGCRTGIAFSDADAAACEGAELIILPKACRFELGANKAYELSILALSAKNHCQVVATNLLGCESGSESFPGRARIACDGNLMAASRELSFARAELLTLEDGVISLLDEHDTVIRAVALGLFDWMAKTRSHGYALSLSGGADSGLCAAAACYGQLAALEDLGCEEYKEIMEGLGFDVGDIGADHETYIKEKIMPQVLTTVYQASHISGSVTRTAAEKLAANIGATYYIWSIADLTAQYTALINATTPDDPLNDSRDDLTLQNIQARSRGPGIWMIANRYNKLLVTTCNSSEDAVGYCTMDGDTCGGVAPLGDVAKSRILKINTHIARDGVKVNDSVTLHLPDMSYVAEQTPTAELRPGQTDERDLMPYPVLDRIHVLNQLGRLMPQQVLDALRGELADKFSDEELVTFVKRYFMKLARNQWKRERGAPTFHIQADDLAAGSGFAFPILNDGLDCLLSGLK